MRPVVPPTANDPAPPAPRDRTARKPAAAAVTPRSPVRVSFTHPDEWYDELRADADLVEHGIVRTCVRRTPADAASGMQKVDVIAGFIARGVVVELVTVCGVDWHTESDTDKATITRAEDVLERAASLCRDLGLTQRGGRFGALE